MTYPINITIPDEDNDPLEDVQPMRQNFGNIDGYLTVDHVAPGAPGDGFHKKVTWNDVETPAAPTGTQGIDYTIDGIAQPGTPQRVFQNAQNTFPVSAIKAYGRILCSTPAFQQSFNTTGAPSFSLPTVLNFDVLPNLVSNNAVVIATVTWTGAGTNPFIRSTSISGDTVSITFNTGSPVAEVVNFLILEM